MEKKESAVVEAEEELNEESFHTDSDYWDLKRYLELKNTMKKIFNNPKRAKALRDYISNKNQVKDDIRKISEDENYVKGLGI